MPEESTTPDLVELAQRRIDSVNAGDIGAATSLFAPEIVREGLFQTFEGRAAARGFVQDWVDAYDEFALVPEEVLISTAGWPSLCSSSAAGREAPQVGFISGSERGIGRRVR